ncbi:DUF6153 family protein [Microbacterium sp. Gd 4-13]|uniref:DUF6153 family protein n=1 Tax=Microbacterium sp. Gd 4-13 TaxID=2173179 RepID=UPI001F0B7C35|nr:DUF6153 family protein [Microbacterium sp. Gd 4-13]
MSLIAVAHQVRGTRTLTRTLLLLIAVTVAIIVGLLAMHSLNTHTTATGHADTVATASDTSAAMDHDQTATTPEAAEACADCGSDGPAMSWMACVLALLATALLLLRPTGGWRIISPATVRAGPTAAWPALAHTLPPPSLTVLCISRT